jgi:predicted RNA-binding Zn-ribbon protein involved in translation (DUF1610 family)
MPKQAPLDLSSLLIRLRTDYPHILFVAGTRFAWHAEQQHIRYRSEAASTPRNIAALLHELSHALLGHANYRHDIELLQLEAAAWEQARKLAGQYQIVLDEDTIQDCLDTYRDWLHLRATCPTCFARSLQTSPSSYQCHNCGAQWSVTRSRLCRPYRRQAVSGTVTATPFASAGMPIH